MKRVPTLTVEPDDAAGTMEGTLRLRFHDPEVPLELGNFLIIVLGHKYDRQVITRNMCSRFEAQCYDMMIALTERRILWQDPFYPWSWRLDERKLRQWATYMAVRLSAFGM